MTIHLPEELERYVHSEVLNGRFASEDEAITEAVRLLRQRQQQTPVSVNARSEEELEQQLIQSGFLANVAPRPGRTASQRDFRPIAIEGEPLSETVIRERR